VTQDETGAEREHSIRAFLPVLIMASRFAPPSTFKGGGGKGGSYVKIHLRELLLGLLWGAA
jgi:hypothetical protein